ncbi:intelectin-1-like [Heptranchias perlo]|uniref:intelectin-1-like n=1 Tax=Heptranchias perlo TaxID=212740 RepID=UPI00355A196A
MTVDSVPYQTFCDMSTSGGGWTLVASIHENNIFGKCTTGDHWTSQQGNNARYPQGEGAWSNYATFGTAVGATVDDFKNQGYFGILASDLSVWHVPNSTPWRSWRSSAMLRYHTRVRFLFQQGGNLFKLFQRYPLTYKGGDCMKNHGPSAPIQFDFGNKETTTILYPPYSWKEFVPGFVQFRVYNSVQAPMAMCSGVKSLGCNAEHYCVGGAGFFPRKHPLQCGDFTAIAQSGYEHPMDWTWSAMQSTIQSSILIFYR